MVRSFIYTLDIRVVKDIMCDIMFVFRLGALSRGSAQKFSVSRLCFIVFSYYSHVCLSCTICMLHPALVSFYVYASMYRSTNYVRKTFSFCFEMKLRAVIHQQVLLIDMLLLLRVVLFVDIACILLCHSLIA